MPWGSSGLIRWWAGSSTDSPSTGRSPSCLSGILPSGSSRHPAPHQEGRDGLCCASGIALLAWRLRSHTPSPPTVGWWSSPTGTGSGGSTRKASGASQWSRLGTTNGRRTPGCGRHDYVAQTCDQGRTWFDLGPLGLALGHPVNPEAPRGTNRFHRFDRSFAYRWCKVDTDETGLSLGKVVDLGVRYLELALAW